ncbi:hypothetical protein [Coprobacter fastidiosus]|uniref:hypothetical protein n=1 Tax=Coprobacter fastidiosus TaxID=1099853 RepID=UPI002670388D|nr:hypothetical protein [Coprobacter fastidiosus]
MNNWTCRHGGIFSSLIKELEKANIRYFILRNYEQLPNANPSKDIDILIEPCKIKEANHILQQVYKQQNLTHIYLVRFTWVYCWRGMDINNQLSIHIDLIAGYRMKGYEIFTFDELYNQTMEYNGFRVLNRYYEGLIVLIYKQFGYKDPLLKQEYKDIIYDTCVQNPQFSNDLQILIGKSLTQDITTAIMNKNFDLMLSYSKRLTTQLKKYAVKKDTVGVFFRIIEFYWLKFQRIILFRKRYGKSFSVMAPDGAGKTTFLNLLIKNLSFYYLRETELAHVLHFRPEILPNLGAVGEKARVMKQDKNFTIPHRAKPAGLFSSLIRITYYWFDYVIGWFIYTSKDIQYDRFTVFDRYSYDLLVDPRRTRLSLPYWIRKLYVELMPHPRFTFYLDVESDEIFRRKQELTPDEINRQIGEYHKLVKSSKRFIVLNGNHSVEQIMDDAIRIILDTFCTKLK